MLFVSADVIVIVVMLVIVTIDFTTVKPTEVFALVVILLL